MQLQCQVTHAILTKVDSILALRGTTQQLITAIQPTKASRLPHNKGHCEPWHLVRIKFMVNKILPINSVLCIHYPFTAFRIRKKQKQNEAVAEPMCASSRNELTTEYSYISLLPSQ